MNWITSALLILLTTASAASAQSTFTGSWDGEETGPWRLTIIVTGQSVAGRIVPPGSEVFDGRVEGNTIAFKAMSPDGDRTVSFTGTLQGEVIAFTRSVQVRPGGNAGGTGMFGALGREKFTARRVGEADLAAEVLGRELASALNLLDRNVKAEGRIFLPERISRYRAVIVAALWGLGTPLYEDLQVRRLAATTQSALLLVRVSEIGPSQLQRANSFGAQGGEALIRLLQLLAKESDHAELATAPLLFWGHSAGSAFGLNFALTHPDRTIAFVLYHGGGGLGLNNAKVLAGIPALAFVGGKDDPKLQQGGDEFWRSGRAVGAVWAYAFEPEAEHMAVDSMEKANPLLAAWVTSVLRMRIPDDGRPGLRQIDSMVGWLGDNRTGQVQPVTNGGNNREASWLPDQASAEAWRNLTRR